MVVISKKMMAIMIIQNKHFRMTGSVAIMLLMMMIMMTKLMLMVAIQMIAEYFRINVSRMSDSVAMWAGNSPPPLLHLTARCWASLTILLFLLLPFLLLLLIMIIITTIIIFLAIIIMSPQLHSSPSWPSLAHRHRGTPSSHWSWRETLQSRRRGGNSSFSLFFSKEIISSHHSIA